MLMTESSGSKTSRTEHCLCVLLWLDHTSLILPFTWCVSPLNVLSRQLPRIVPTDPLRGN